MKRRRTRTAPRLQVNFTISYTHHAAVPAARRCRPIFADVFSLPAAPPRSCRSGVPGTSHASPDAKRNPCACIYPPAFYPGQTSGGCGQPCTHARHAPASPASAPANNQRASTRIYRAAAPPPSPAFSLRRHAGTAFSAPCS